MNFGDKILSKNWESWENPRRPMATTPLLIIAGGGVGWITFSQLGFGDIGVYIGALLTAMLTLLVGYVVLAYFDG